MRYAGPIVISVAVGSVIKGDKTMVPKTVIVAGVLVTALCAAFVCASVNLYVGITLGVGMIAVYPRALKVINGLANYSGVPTWDEGYESLFKIQMLISLAFLALCFVIIPGYPTIALVVGIIMSISFLFGIASSIALPIIARKFLV